eukprot:TRINITY_DN15244_c0_g1_i1.p1 TRINITY_DN15244_c0_g1~~TRINITY_DN15244_c0_g1_i1.p1  ORF type:complete len:462 (-),score=99.36 TRINITY_DN15244_c0_g1_i1:187-1509(-)
MAPTPSPAAGGRLSQVCRLKGHEDRVWSVAWRPSSSPPQLATCGSDRNILVWALRSKAQPDAKDAWHLVAEVDASEQHTRTLRSVTWSQDGQLLACTSFDATTSVWRQEQGDEQSDSSTSWECVTTVTGHENEVKSAAFSPSGEYLATCSRDKSVWIYNISGDSFEYECAAILQSHSQDVKMVRWHPEQDVLFSCSYDDTIKIWGPDGDDWACMETLSGHESTVWALAFDDHGTRFASCSDDRTLRIWAPTEAVPPSEPAAPAKEAEASPSKASDTAGLLNSTATAAFVSPLFRGAALLAAADSESASASSSSRRRAEVPKRAPKNAACSWSEVARIEDAHDRPIYCVDWLPAPPTSTASTPARSYVATACGDNFLRVFQPVDEENLFSRWQCIAEIEAHNGDVNGAAWFPTPLPGSGGLLLATVGDDAEVAIWRLGEKV